MSVAGPMQPLAGKLPPVPRAGFATGNEAEEGRATARYVHTTGSSSQAVGFIGTSRDGEQITREWKRQKTVNQAVDSLKRCGRHKEAQSLSQCAQHFRIRAKKTGEYKLLPIHCDSPFCADCSNRHSRPFIKKLKGLVNRKGMEYWHATLTVPNIENLLKLDVLELQNKWSKLWNSWVFQEVEGADGKLFRIYGAVRSVEVTYNAESKTWHPHIHVIFEAKRGLPGWWLVLLKAAWNGLNDGSCYVHLSRVYSVLKRGGKKYGRLTEKALKEVCKYVTKFAPFARSPQLVEEFLTAFKGVRRIQCCGSFYGAQAATVSREPGEDETGISEAGGTVHGEGYFDIPFTAPISDTVLLGTGERQLTFAFAERVRDYIRNLDPPWALSEVPVVTSEQNRIKFAGAMPEKSEWQPELFEGAA